MTYIPTTWIDDETGTNPIAPDINADNLNHIEEGISDVDAAISALTATEILDRLKTVDGVGSGLDADLLDGFDSLAFLRSNGSTTLTGNLLLGTGAKLDFFDEFGEKALYYSTTYKRGVLTGVLWDMTTNYYRIYDDADTPGTSTPRLELDTVLNVLKVNNNTVWHGGNALTNLLAIDGAGSLLDADFLDGLDSTAFIRTNSSHLENFLAGLNLQWNSPGTNFNNITATPGACWLPGSSKVLNVPSTLTPASGSPAANTWYHFYVFDNAGTAAIEASTTAPVSYKGNAHQKTGDNTRRYIGSRKTDAAGKFFNFLKTGDMVRYLENQNQSPFTVLNAGLSTTEATVSCSAAVPVTSRLVKAQLENVSTAQIAWFGNSIDSATGGAAGGVGYVGAARQFSDFLTLDSSQAFSYWYTAATTGGLYVMILGFEEVR